MCEVTKHQRYQLTFWLVITVISASEAVIYCVSHYQDNLSYYSETCYSEKAPCVCSSDRSGGEWWSEFCFFQSGPDIWSLFSLKWAEMEPWHGPETVITLEAHWKLEKCWNAAEASCGCLTGNNQRLIKTQRKNKALLLLIRQVWLAAALLQVCNDAAAWQERK